MKKKNWLWLLLVPVLAFLGFIVLRFLPNNQSDAPLTMDEDPLGITYFMVPPMEQVFVNGVVKPEQSQDFHKDANLGEISDLMVTNGDIVEEDTLLYSYTNDAIQKEINQLTNEAARLETQRANTAYKQQLAIDRWYEVPQEERSQTLDEIYMEFNLSEIDSQITEQYANIELLESEVYTEVLAPFKGKVVIPEEKTAEAPLMKLISENFYVSGTLNEKDLEKVKVDQAADITVVSTNFTTLGKVSFVDTTPTEANSDPYSGMATMSSYPVKLSFDSLEGIVNGYHVQATIQLEETQIMIPTEAIHKEGDTAYVLVNDFGTVAKRTLQLGDETAEGTLITSGLEAEDEIILSSETPVQEGDILDPGMMEMPEGE